MKGRKRRIYSLLAVLFLTVPVFYGCGRSTGKVYDQTGEEMTWSDLDPDSIPVAPEPDSYYIGYGDVLDVDFLYEKQYSMTNVRVRPDGRITYPLAGEIFVAGMSPSELDSVLTEKFSEIVLDPQVTVMVKEVTPQMVYVLGEVGTPGDYEYVRGMTLMRALAVSYGYTENARKSNVLVIRRVAEDHIVGIEVNVDAILSKNDFSLDVPLKPFDIVYVPKSRIATTEQFIEKAFNIISKPLDIYLKGWQVANIKLYYDYYSRTVAGVR